MVRTLPARRAFTAALALHLALVFVLGELPAAPGEPLFLRWARSLAEHPVRGPIALGLLLFALAPGRGSASASSDQEGPPDGGERGSDALEWSLRRPGGDSCSDMPAWHRRGESPYRPLPQPTMTLAIQLEELVLGPLELPVFGRSVTVYPTQETARAGRYPSQAVVVTAAARRIIELSKGGEKVESVVVHGEVDPTRHPEFSPISENLRELCNKWFPKARLCLLSEQPVLENPQVRHALSFYDVPSLRFEAGTQKTHAALGGGEPGGLRSLVDELARLEHRNLVLRATFVRGKVDNSTDNEVRAWIRYLSRIKPSVVEVSTPAKADSKDRRPITKTRMGQIQAQLAEKVACAVEIVAD